MVEEIIKPGYTRVSNVASAFAGYGQVPKKIMDYTADRGTLVHKIIDDLLNDLVVPESKYIFEGKSVKPYVESWEKYWDTLPLQEIYLQEKRLYGEEIKITGCMDLIAEVDGQMILFDWKTSRDVGNHWKLQAGGYLHILKEHNITIDKIIFVKLDKEGGDVVLTEYEAVKGLIDLFNTAYDLYMMFFKDLKLDMEMD
jgi:regulator of RNase E activity RraB